MTNTKTAKMQGVSRPSRSPRTGSTVRLDWLMEEAQRLAMAQRITKLRERSPFTQPDIAGKLGIGLRGYQKLEKVGTTKHERCEELAEIHHEWAKDSPDYGHVSADWIWDGRRPADERAADGQVPDLAQVLGHGDADELRQLLVDALDRLDAMQTTLDGEAVANAEMRSQIAELVKPPRRRASGGR